MPTMQKSTSVAASSVNDNVLSGSQYEFLPWDAEVKFGLVASATGLVLDVYSGSDAIAEGYEPSTQNRFPLFPDDFTLVDVAAAGERLKIRARNTTAGALTLFHAVQLTPVG